jgi:methionyl-tRNA formyltransferase
LVAPDGKETVLKIFKTRKTGKPTTAGKGSITVEGKSLLVAASNEWLAIEELQLAGKKRMATHDFLNGMKDMESYSIK